MWRLEQAVFVSLPGVFAFPAITNLFEEEATIPTTYWKQITNIGQPIQLFVSTEDLTNNKSVPINKRSIMKFAWKRSVLLALALVPLTEGFAPPNNANSSPRPSTRLEMATKRRETFGWFRRAVLGGIGLSTYQKVQPVQAEEDGGKVITFTVDNLDGIEGKTGQFKIQMQPSWAPRGVERFEVSHLAHSQRRGSFLVVPDDEVSKESDCSISSLTFTRCL